MNITNMILISLGIGGIVYLIGAATILYANNGLFNRLSIYISFLFEKGLTIKKEVIGTETNLTLFDAIDNNRLGNYDEMNTFSWELSRAGEQGSYKDMHIILFNIATVLLAYLILVYVNVYSMLTIIGFALYHTYAIGRYSQEIRRKVFSRMCSTISNLVEEYHHKEKTFFDTDLELGALNYVKLNMNRIVSDAYTSATTWCINYTNLNKYFLIPGAVALTVINFAIIYFNVN